MSKFIGFGAAAVSAFALVACTAETDNGTSVDISADNISCDWDARVDHYSYQFDSYRNTFTEDFQPVDMSLGEVRDAVNFSRSTLFSDAGHGNYTALKNGRIVAQIGIRSNGRISSVTGPACQMN